MATLAEFFKGSDERLGTFYPNHCLVAVFRNRETAQKVASKLYSAGFTADEAVAADGREVLELEKDEMGLGAFVMQAISRFFGTEQKFADHDLEHARHGAGFVAARCPNEKSKEKAWNIIKGDSPLDARFYGLSGIEHLAGDVQTD